MLGLALLAAAPSPAHAQEDVRARARAHAKQAAAYYENGVWGDAITEYEAAYALVPHPQLLYDIAQCYRQKGDKAKAVEVYRRFLVLQPEGPGSADALHFIAQLTGELEAERAEEVRRLTAEAEAAEKRAEAAARTSQSTDDPQRIEAALRAEEARRRATEAENHRRQAAEDAAAARRAEVEHAHALVAESHVSSRGMRLSGAITAGVGVVVIGLAALSGASAQSSSDKVSTATGSWTHALTQEVDAGQSAETRMYVLYGVGGAALLAGSIIWAVGATQHEEQPRAPALDLGWAPLVGPTSAGLSMRGRF